MVNDEIDDLSDDNASKIESEIESEYKTNNKEQLAEKIFGSESIPCRIVRTTSVVEGLMSYSEKDHAFQTSKMQVRILLKSKLGNLPFEANQTEKEENAKDW